MQTQNILIVASGTGGHVFPALVIADQFTKNNFNINWIGTEKGIEHKVVHYEINNISMQGIRGKNIFKKIQSLYYLILSFIQSLQLINKHKPKLMIGFGGFVTVPVALACLIKKIPIIIHEQNSIPGSANKIISKFANLVLTGLPNNLQNSQFIGNPIRHNFEIYKKKKSQNRNLLILGGSLGAKPINQIIKKISQKLIASNIQIVHQTGEIDFEDTKNFYKEKNIPIKTIPFIKNILEEYQIADLIICRSGALTISELTALGKASILIPLPHAIDNHQFHNAKYLEKNNAAIIFEQSQITEDNLLNAVIDLFNNKDKLEKIGRNALILSKPNAHEIFFQKVLGIINKTNEIN